MYVYLKSLTLQFYINCGENARHLAINLKLTEEID